MARREEEYPVDPRDPRPNGLPTQEEISKLASMSHDEALEFIKNLPTDDFGYIINLHPEETLALIHALSVNNGGRSVVLNLGAAWCGDCANAKEGLDEIFGQRQDIDVVLKVRVDQQSKEAIGDHFVHYPMARYWRVKTDFDLISIPAVIIYQKGVQVRLPVQYNQDTGVGDFLMRVGQIFEPPSQRQVRNGPPVV